MNEIFNILEKKEQPIWEDKPKFGPYVTSIFLSSVFVSAILGVFAGMFLSSFIIGIALGAVFIVIYLVIGLLNYNFTHYVLTDKRAIYQSGIFGRSYKSINYDDIKNVSVVKGFFNWLFNTGTVHIFTGEMRSTGGDHPQIVPKYDSFLYISDSDAVLRKLQENISEREEGLYGGKNVIQRVQIVK